MFKHIFIAIIIIFAAACAPASVVQQVNRPGVSQQGNLNLVTPLELHEAVLNGHTQLVDALRQVRPAFLRTDGQTLTVYLNNTRLNDITALESVSAEMVKSVRRYRSTSAPIEYPAEKGWVLVVTLQQ